MSRRPRRSAAEIAGRQRSGGWFAIGLIVVGLVVVFSLKSAISDGDSELMTQLLGDPELELPESVLDQVDGSDASSPDDGGQR